MDSVTVQIRDGHVHAPAGVAIENIVRAPAGGSVPILRQDLPVALWRIAREKYPFSVWEFGVLRMIAVGLDDRGVPAFDERLRRNGSFVVVRNSAEVGTDPSFMSGAVRAFVRAGQHDGGSRVSDHSTVYQVNWLQPRHGGLRRAKVTLPFNNEFTVMDVEEMFPGLPCELNGVSSQYVQIRPTSFNDVWNCADRYARAKLSLGISGTPSFEQLRDGWLVDMGYYIRRMALGVREIGDLARIELW